MKDLHSELEEIKRRKLAPKRGKAFVCNQSTVHITQRDECNGGAANGMVQQPERSANAASYFNTFASGATIGI